MDAAAVRQEQLGHSVTQEEAASMIELWTRLDESEALLKLTDVSEALHISEGEAQGLLAQVRSKPTSSALSTSRVRVTVLRGLLAVSLFLASLFIGGCLADLHSGGHRLTATDWLTAAACATWIIVWLWYYRRPIRRVMGKGLRGSS